MRAFTTTYDISVDAVSALMAQKQAAPGELLHEIFEKQADSRPEAEAGVPLDTRSCRVEWKRLSSFHMGAIVLLGACKLGYLGLDDSVFNLGKQDLAGAQQMAVRQSQLGMSDQP